MSSYDALKILDFDHLEFAVADLDRAAAPFLRMGFERVATREILERKLRSYLLVQNGINVLLSHSALPQDPVARYLARHGDGIFAIGLRCEDALSALETAVNRGAEVLEPPKAYQKDFGSVQLAAIKGFGDVRHTFVSRTGGLFGEGFDSAVKPSGRGFGLERIDHITCNTDASEFESWCQFYERVFGLKNTRTFDVHGERSGLHSRVMESPDGVIKLPVNAPGEGANQIQEYLDINHGPGVQHVAFTTSGIVDSLRHLRREGLVFIEPPPDAYYESLLDRLPNVTERVEDLQEQSILVDGTDSGYLLQIYSRNVVGPFFFEVIQRKGDHGFGEGNFRALFEAYERDQIRRGVLK